jgi:putative mRNA 3-end processing factor
MEGDQSGQLDAGRILTLTPDGLYCPAGDFHVDPWRPVERAVITHAHSDHARFGHRRYLTASPGVEVLRRRLGDVAIQSLPFGETIAVGSARVSLHPAGHILGSAQVRIEVGGDVAVVSGDYKTEPDPTCAPFEPVRCRLFVTESTFGLPIYRWRPDAELRQEIDGWWRGNQAAERTSVLFAYALGKAQRILAGLDPAIGPILAHGAVMPLIEAYRRAGVALPRVEHAADATARVGRGKALVVAPPSAASPGWLRRFGDTSTAFASGWMAIRGTRRNRGVDRGFAVSDHADWPGLLSAIAATEAEEVWVTHGSSEVLARWLGEQGLAARAIATRFEGEAGGEETQEPPEATADSPPEDAPAA